MQGYLSTRVVVDDLRPEVVQTWVQSGLALSPFAFTETRFSVDWVIAWAMH